MDYKKEKIYTYLRLMIRCATNSTPKTSARAKAIQTKKRDGRAYYVRFSSESSDVDISGVTSG